MKYFYKKQQHIFEIWLLSIFLGLLPISLLSQTIISTQTGSTNYSGVNGITGNGAVTFVIENTNTFAITLKQVDLFWKASQSGAVPKIWYSATSLSGAPFITAGEWSLISTGSALTIPSDGYYTTISGLTFMIPASTQYRFAIESSNGISYSGSTTIIPTPNTFSSSGVNLKAGNARDNGLNIGYGGGFPSPTFNPRFFTGRIVFSTCAQPGPPIISDTSICEGSTAALRITGGNLNNATDWKWYTSSCNGTLAGNGSSLTVTPAGTTTYYVRAEGGCATAGICVPVTVTVKPVPGKPIINPLSSICANTVGQLIINTATPVAAVWSPATKLYTNVSCSIPYDGTTALLQVYAKPAATTIYTAVAVSNGCSSEPATITLTVNNPINISSQPASKTICQSGNAVFTVASNGTAPTYQWFVINGSNTLMLSNNSNYNGVTSSTLTVTNAPYLWNGYKYICRATSHTPCTSTDTSDAALLTVTATPVITLLSSPYTSLMPGISTTITASAEPAASSYNWYRNNVGIPSVTTNSLKVSADEIGLYKVKVVDANGCSSTSAGLAIKDSVSAKMFIYPNPNNGQFQLRYYSGAGNATLRIVMINDAMGNLVFRKAYSINSAYARIDIDLRSFGKGVYMVNLLNFEGMRIAAGKVLIAH